MAKQNLSAREKFGFGLGDMSSNIVYQAIANLLLYFYTDVYGIEVAAASFLILIVRAADAIIDPVIGGLADRTRTQLAFELPGYWRLLPSLSCARARPRERT